MEKEKNTWEMAEEEQNKYWDEKTNELINLIVSKLIRNTILSNKKFIKKITKEIKNLIKEKTLREILKSDQDRKYKKTQEKKQ